MEQQEAVRIFDLVVKEHMLPATLDKLVPLSFMGAAAVKFYQAKVKLMDQLGATEEQRKATLRDGQDAGEMLLNIEARIGELALSEPQSQARGGNPLGGRGKTPTGLPSKAERLGFPSDKSMKSAESIHRNPAAVAAIIKEARENEDIPTKTAVLNKIKADKYKEKLAKVPMRPKDDISDVALGISNKLGELFVKLTEMWEYKDSIPKIYRNGIIDAITMLYELVTEDEDE